MSTVESAENGSTVPYRDANLPIDDRVEDLLSRMTLAEKAGLMFQDMIMPGPGGTLMQETNPLLPILPTDELIGQKLMSHFNLLGGVKNAREIAQWYNRLQKRALETRLGIPVTLSSDPRNHFTDNLGTSFLAGILSQWPETLGLAALRSEELVERFANVARQEYLALGIRTALHPQIDLATEPRWSRIAATFGEDADLSSKLVAAYIRGFQGSHLGPESVATMTKHFPGGGPQKDGEDPHFDYGKEQVYPGNNMEYHLKPFKAAIAAGTTQMMPLGFAFNKSIITDLLRNECGFTGIVCTDWGLITDAVILGQPMPARAWGVEHLNEVERVQKVIEAGCDQFGGESRPDLVIELVEKGLIPESRLDESVRRLLREKFTLGLFEQPFVDEEAAASIVGNSEFVKEGEDAQRRAFTLLTNKNNILPLKKSDNMAQVYVEGVDTALVQARGFQVVKLPSDADFALLRLKAPYEQRPGIFASMFHAGSLEFPDEEKARLATILEAVPTIIDIYLDRPAVFPELATSAAALLASYGSNADAFLDVVLGLAGPEGKLPFDLPSSMKAVEESRSDMPYDTENPVFRFGHGLQY
ncbi:hypothetical protein N7488_000028 [Penicillium malachiteum]|nr:hypothetical protein N7488_000028 [Penicillium malachiteum]